MINEPIQRMLERLGQALSAGDAKTASKCWEVPALLLSEDGVMVLDDIKRIEGFFSHAIEAYRSRGIVSTKPDIEGTDRLSEKLTAVDVRWPGLDATGRVKSSERSHYVLQQGSDGEPRIRVAITRTL